MAEIGHQGTQNLDPMTSKVGHQGTHQVLLIKVFCLPHNIKEGFSALEST